MSAPTTEALELTRVGKWLGVPRFLGWEATGIRALFALVILQALPLDPVGEWPLIGSGGLIAPSGRLSYEGQPLPTGMAQWLDFSVLSAPALQPWLWGIFLLCLLSYVTGRGLVISLPVLAGLFIAARTLENSQGFISHKYQVIGAILAVQALVVLVWGAAGMLKIPNFGAGRARMDYLIRYAQIAAVGGYVIAGISKWDRSDGEWVQNSHYLGLDLVKTDRQNYYTRVPDHPPKAVPMAVKMLEHRHLSRLAMGLGLLLEFACILALFHRSMALFFGVALIVFHQMVGHLMQLHFPFNEKALFVFLVNPVFWVGMGLLWVRAWFSGSRAPEKQGDFPLAQPEALDEGDLRRPLASP